MDSFRSHLQIHAHPQIILWSRCCHGRIILSVLSNNSRQGLGLFCAQENVIFGRTYDLPTMMIVLDESRGTPWILSGRICSPTNPFVSLFLQQNNTKNEHNEGCMVTWTSTMRITKSAFLAWSIVVLSLMKMVYARRVHETPRFHRRGEA